MNKHCRLSLVAVGCAAGVAGSAHASILDLMQIEQVIGGVDGDTAAQAIQLRMRDDFQCFLSLGKLMAHDAAGENPVLLIDFQSDLPGCSLGDRVLIVSENFCPFLDDHQPADFTLTNLIPQSYLAAGSITFEDNAGTIIFWRLSWGGKNYTGPTDGSTINDADGEFGPPWPGPLPSDSLQALQFQGPADAQSTNNQDDYALTKGTSNWTNNAGLTDHLTTCPADFDKGDGCAGVVGVTDLLFLLAAWGPTPPEGHPADLDCNGTVGIPDLLMLLAAWGPCPCP